MIRIGILASGSGTNAEKIMDYFTGSRVAEVALLMSDNPGAFALTRASRHGVPTVVFSRPEFADGEKPLAALRANGVDYIVLAGFLRLIPLNIIKAYPGRIVNIHPALLPKYGGKGMYGDRVHRAVIEAGERESGITIHNVNENYDEGAVIAQFCVEVAPDETPDTLAAKIHVLEHTHFPAVIEREILKISYMEQEKQTRLILRSLADAQAQAERILRGNDHRQDIETFARFCSGLNDYIRTHSGREDMVAALDEIPDVQYEKLRDGLLQYMFVPGWLDRGRKTAVLEQVRRVREKYAMLELRVRGIKFDA